MSNGNGSAGIGTDLTAVISDLIKASAGADKSRNVLATLLTADMMKSFVSVGAIRPTGAEELRSYFNTLCGVCAERLKDDSPPVLAAGGEGGAH